MTPRDPADDQLREAFRARLDAAAEPSNAMLSRTLRAIGEQPSRALPRPASPKLWWSALAGPTRFVTAAAIVVVVGGTIAFGTLKASHDRGNATDTAPARLSFERLPRRTALIARSGSIRVSVRDVPAAAHRVDAIAQRENGEVLSRTTSPERSRGAYAQRVVLRVPARQLDATMDALAALGAVEARRIETSDLSGLLEATTLRLRNALKTPDGSSMIPPEPGSLPGSSPGTEIRRLLALRATLERRITGATIAVVLQAAGEPAPLGLRRTSIPLARGPSFAAHRSVLARRRFRPFDPSASGALAADPATERTAAAGNPAADRLRERVARAARVTVAVPANFSATDTSPNPTADPPATTA